jgi:hypothetical protein
LFFAFIRAKGRSILIDVNYLLINLSTAKQLKTKAFRKKRTGKEITTSETS